MAQNPIDLSRNEKSSLNQCHLMPCKIADNECHEIRAKEYFWPTVRPLVSTDDNDDEVKELKRPDNYVNTPDDPVLLASFRGRPLQGRTIKLPEGYHGYAMSRTKSGVPSKVAPQRKHFDKITYWNWDELPSDSDPTVKAISWVNIAKAIHDPIEN